MAVRRAREERRGRFWRGVARWGAVSLLSLLLHALLLLFLSASGSPLLAPTHSSTHQQGRPSQVALRGVAPSDWAKNRAIAAEPRASAQRAPNKVTEAEPSKPPEPPKPEASKAPGQVVDVAPGNGEAPDRAAFAAETNNRVERESAARQRDITPNVTNRPMDSRSPSARPEAAPPGESPSEAKSGLGGISDDRQTPKAGSKRRRAVVEIPKAAQRDALALAPGSDGLGRPSRPGSDAFDGTGERLRLLPGGEEGEEAAGQRGEGNTLRLTPSTAALGKIMGMPSSDYLPDVEEGEGTFLNTKEWKYSTYFNRVSREVGSYWRSHVVAAMRQYDPTSEVYLYKDRRTVLSITLDSEGELHELTVHTPSGAEFLDREALEAFRRAQRFPNPPGAIRDLDGYVRFNFAFVITTDGPRFKLFR